MADHLRDATKKVEFISREAAVEAVWKPEVRPNDLIFDALRRACEEEVKHIPAADVVARDCYDRILAENDTMRKQLAQIGKKPGDRMDDVRRCGVDMEGNENG